MPRVGLEPTITVFERAKTFHTLDRAATTIVSVVAGEVRDVRITALKLAMPS
jgi:hypothetical protein